MVERACSLGLSGVTNEAEVLFEIGHLGRGESSGNKNHTVVDGLIDNPLALLPDAGFGAYESDQARA